MEEYEDPSKFPDFDEKDSVEVEKELPADSFDEKSVQEGEH